MSSIVWRDGRVCNHSLRMKAASAKHLERVRKTCMALPYVTEKLSHGEPTFFVRKRVFAMFDNNHHNDGNPMNALSTDDYTEAWRRLGRELPSPSAILSISAHWFIPSTRVTIATEPRTILLRLDPGRAQPGPCSRTCVDPFRVALVSFRA